MLFLPLDLLRPGMTLAKDVGTDSVNFFSLVVAGQKLTPAIINKLESQNIPGAYIESSFALDIKAEDVITPELKKETVQDLKRVFNEYTKQNTITATSYRAIRQTAENLLMYTLSKEDCLVNIIEIKEYDTYTYTHSMYVGILSALIAIQLGLTRSQQLDLCTCGLLHDTGKLDMPVEIINKPSKLTTAEFTIIKQHPDKAVERLARTSGFSSVILGGIRTHHERYDGTGYPLGLKGGEIPLYGRILALADVYDALTSQRSYRKAWASSEAIEYMMGGAQSHFDYTILQAFLHTVAAYPVGSLVKLSNGEMAVVIKNYPDNILRPRVRVFCGESQLGKEIDLSQDFNYLSLTIAGIIDSKSTLPKGLTN